MICLSPAAPPSLFFSSPSVPSASTPSTPAPVTPSSLPSAPLPSLTVATRVSTPRDESWLETTPATTATRMAAAPTATAWRGVNTQMRCRTTGSRSAVVSSGSSTNSSSSSACSAGAGALADPPGTGVTASCSPSSDAASS